MRGPGRGQREDLCQPVRALGNFFGLIAYFTHRPNRQRIDAMPAGLVDNAERRTMDLFDVEAIERVESELDLFINKRSKAKEKANAEEELWRVSERRQRRKVRLANGHAWVDYFDHLALCHERRAGEYRDRSREVAAMVADLSDETGPEASPPSAEELRKSIAAEGGGG